MLLYVYERKSRAKLNGNAGIWLKWLNNFLNIIPFFVNYATPIEFMGIK